MAEKSPHGRNTPFGYRGRKLCEAALAGLGGEARERCNYMRLRLEAASNECLRGCHYEGGGAQALAEAKRAFQAAKTSNLPLSPAFALVGRCASVSCFVPSL